MLLLVPTRRRDTISAMRKVRRLNRWGWFFLLSLTMAVVLACLPSEIFARAGGGGGYRSSGGGSSGRGGGGAGGGLSLLFDIVVYLIRYPYLGVPVLIIIIVFVIFASRQGNETYKSGVIRKGTGAVSDAKSQAVIARLREQDANFDATAFCTRVETAFQKIQAAWCGQDLATVRPFISDGVHERFTLQFDEQRELGYREKMDQQRTQGLAVVDLASDGLFDEIAVRIRAVAADYRVSLKDGSHLSGSRSVEPFTEYWSFLRRRGTQTAIAKSGLIEGNCPNCGASIELNQSAVCSHCKALLRSGEYDWVLAEITQESEWNGLSRGDMPGVPELRERDPDFDVLALEDRASVIFWRKVATDRTSKIGPLRKMASPEFCNSYQSALNTPTGVKRSYYGDCAVGAVITLGVIPGSKEDSQSVDRALVEIRWAGTRHLQQGNNPPKSTGEYGLFRTLFVLSRSVATKTDLGMSIASAHCPNCGAPESSSDAEACEFCGTVLNDGTRGWVLSGAIPTNSTEGQALLEEVEGQSPGASSTGEPPVLVRDATSLLAWLVRVAAADGNIDKSEMKLLMLFADRRNIPLERLRQMIEAARVGTLDAPMPSGPPEARAWVTEMITIGLADGTVGKEEYAVFRALGERMGLAVQDIDLLIKKSRASQYATARDALRAVKRGDGN